MAKAQSRSNNHRLFIATRIKQLRSDREITQVELAKACGLNRSYLADIEKVNRNFGIDTLDRILHGLEVGYAEFFEGY